MKILLAQKLPYIQSFTGASKANRMLMEELARRNHSCRMVVFASSRPSLAASTDRGVPDQTIYPAPEEESEPTTVFACEGVEVHAVSRTERFEAYLLEQIAGLNPDVILISEDRSFLSLLAAMESDVPVVFVCHSQATLPFGPESFELDPTKTDVLRRASAMVAPSQYVCDYIRRWGGIDSTLLRFDTYGRGPFPDLARFGEGSVLMINPSQIKGLPVFLELARRFPTVPFCAIPTWATTADDCRELARLPNVRLMRPFDSMDDLFRQATVLLVPSLWGEAFPTSVIEAMLRGIPVLASNVGGLPEAKLGVDYLLAVSPIERYERSFDQHRLPIPVVPRQDIDPWQEALTAVLSAREPYERVSRESRDAALSFVRSLDLTPFEELLLGLQRSTAGPRGPTEGVREGERLPGGDLSVVNRLSPERVELLAVLLHQDVTDSESDSQAPRPPGDHGNNLGRPLRAGRVAARLSERNHSDSDVPHDKSVTPTDAETGEAS